MLRSKTERQPTQRPLMTPRAPQSGAPSDQLSDQQWHQEFSLEAFRAKYQELHFAHLRVFALIGATLQQ